MDKTIRFGDLVRNSGRPQTVTLWTKPQDNPELARAIKQNRVLTVVQETGKKDHGFIGFKTLPGALYLEFPKALPHAQDVRVVGLNYQLIDEPTVPERNRVNPLEPKTSSVKPATKSPLHLKPEKPPLPKPQPKPVVPKPQPQEFTIKIRRTASVEDEIKVKALDRPDAERLALERAMHKSFKPGRNVRAEIVKPEQTEA